jgi:hypothetical protein
MDDQQRATLQSLLRSTEKVPPQHRLEAIEVSVNTHLGLYRQERDQSGARIYEGLKSLVEHATSVADLEKLVAQKEAWDE